jgi:tetratricopeptide (TPR) repeat protein
MLRRFLLYPLFSFVLIFSGLRVSAQGGDHYVDSLRKGVALAKTPSERIHSLLNLMYATTEPSIVDSIANQAVETAQLSRDRRLISLVYLVDGRRFMNNSGLADNLDRAEKSIRQAERVAKEDGIEDLLTYCYCTEADVWHFRGNDQKAMDYANEAMAVAATADNDSAKMVAYASLGRVYSERNEMLLSFRNYLEALNIAETSGNERMLRNAYADMAHFYESIHEYDKAIDYVMKAYVLDRKSWDYYMVFDEYHMGELFVQNNQPEVGLQMYERSLRLIDTLQFPLMKLDVYFRIFNMYFHNNEYAKGLHSLQGHPEVMNYLKVAGFGFFMQQINGMVYAEQGRFDSALYCFRAAEPDVLKKSNPEEQNDFFSAFGNYYIRRKDYPSAIVYYKKAMDVADAARQLEWEEKNADTLKHLYELSGDYRGALIYTAREEAEQDSLRTQGRATDLMRLEVENDKRRRDRLAKEEEENTERRHNVQYLGFTIGLVVLFIVLVMLGRFAVPPSFIRALGFLSFIFLFEFIILLLDKTIQALTHEEPWKVLLIKIALGAGLVPLHHWLEHKVIHYLSRHQQVARGGGHEPGDRMAAGETHEPASAGVEGRV